MSEIKIIINGKECVGQQGQTILEIAENNGIFIPTLCHLASVKHYGACGVCVVEGEKMPKLMRACSTVASPGHLLPGRRFIGRCRAITINQAKR